ncbi:MAG TPA: VOC family protein [Hyphomicrobiaceae bacterium]|nr:VOC family protein [Hyphomicrobiaceae bacterium]
MPTTSTPAIALRYRDVAEAVEWLCTAFGFEKQTVLTDDAGATVFAQLTFGHAMFMLAPVRDTVIDKLMKQPDEIGGAETQSGYYVVDDADAHCARAKAAGATVILDVEDDDFGGRGYTCRDPEGHIWTFGTYDPWQGKYPEPVAVAPASGGGLRRFMLTVLTIAAIATVGVAAWFGGALTQSSAVSSPAHVQPRPAPAPEKTAALEAAEQAAREVRAQLERERAARASADQASEEAQKRAAEAQQARQAAERAAKEAREQLEQRAAKAADAASADALKRLGEEARAREAAERAVKEARAELDRERKKAAEAPPPDLTKRVAEEVRAREAAERAVKEARADLDRERKEARAELDRERKKAAETPAPDLSKRMAEEARAREAAERAVKEVRAELEKARADKTAAEMAKEFALGRAEEEQAGREAAEKATQEARAALERKGAAVKSAGGAPDPAALKGAADLQRALDEAKKRVGEESRAREEAERVAKEAREQVAKEQAAKTAAWKVISQLTRQLKQAQGETAGGAPDADAAAAAPKKTRRVKKAEEPEQ